MASFPPPPVDSIDWSSVGFKVRDVNGHVECTFSYSTGGQWSPPKFVASPFLPLHGMAPGLNYGQQAYEGLKAFRHPSGQISIFRPDRNAARLQRSAEVVSIPPVPAALFIESVRLAVAANAEFVPPHDTGAAMYIRPLVFGSSAQLGLTPPDEYTFVVFVMPTGVYHGTQAVDALILEDFDRAAPEGTGAAKVGGNYAPVLRHSARAHAAGFGITLHLDSATRSAVDEFSTSAFLGVRKGRHPSDPGAEAGGGGPETVTLVQPDSKSVIDSVTAASVCELGQRMFGWGWERRPIQYDELRDFAEVIAAGTAAALVPIRSITMQSRNEKFDFDCGAGAGAGGEVCVKLLRTLRGIQAGRLEDPYGWNYIVDKAPPQAWLDGAGGHDEGDDGRSVP